ncbi:hypothetical protein [Schaalia sp. Marseille-Q2122]|uniref:hypothetical protein n=1 Tax=Schaalia sp. Marseille-Q2122 TaxID=2736604 RepID=UPI00158F548E|nr:hypothetical protein [Schaalia sp. Marseille-Q2122]
MALFLTLRLPMLDSVVSAVVGGGSLVVGLTIAIAVIWVAVSVFRSRSGRTLSGRVQRSYARDAARDEAAAQQRLLQADEIVRFARDELAFAQAGFGEVRSQEFERALGRAEEALPRAFALQEALRNAPTDAEKSRVALEIIAILDGVMPVLLEEQKRFTELRSKDSGLESRLASLRGHIEETAAQLPAAEERLRGLALSFPSSSLASLEDNPDQARSLLTQAREACGRAEAALGSQRDVAVQALETASRALSMAQHQVQAIFEAEDHLRDAAKALASGIGSLTNDLADARRLDADDSAFGPLIDEARAAILHAQSANDGGGDPLAALERLTAAEAALDAALAPLRSREENLSRQSASAQRYLEHAEASVRSARQFLEARRGVMPLDARSDLREAERFLEDARRYLHSDPERSMRAADNAAESAKRVSGSFAPFAMPGGFAGGTTGQFPPVLSEPRSMMNMGMSVGGALLWQALDTVVDVVMDEALEGKKKKRKKR